MPDSENQNQHKQLSDLLQQAIVNTVVDGVITISLGAAGFEPDNGSTSVLINAADTAHYHSKKTGRNQYTYYGDIDRPDLQ